MIAKEYLTSAEAMIKLGKWTILQIVSGECPTKKVVLTQSVENTYVLADSPYF